MPYDSNKGYYYLDSSFPADTRPDEPEPEEHEALDMGHEDCTECEEARASAYLQAELEAAEAVARTIVGLEARVADLEAALEAIRKIASKNESYIFRHITTVANIALGASKGGK